MKTHFETGRDEADATFEWRLPATFNFGRDVVDAIAEADPRKLALLWCDDAGGELRFSFGDISRRTNQVANLLHANGVSAGQRVIVMLPRIPEWHIAMVACLKVGAVPIPCIDMLTEKDVLYRATHSGASAAITTSVNTPKFADAVAVKTRIAVGSAPGWLEFAKEASGQPAVFECADVPIDAPSIIYYTSGSTGMPKGVTHASRSLYCWRGSAQFWLDLKEDDLMWCTADTGWSKAGTSILFGPWSRGAAVLLYNGRFDPSERLKLIEHHGVTVFCGAATEFKRLVQQDVSGLDLSRLRLTVSAGETVNPEVIRRWADLTGVPLIEAYGQTETLMTVGNRLGAPARAGSMGRALPGCRLQVVDETGRPVPAGNCGHLAVVLPNPQLMLGYWDDPERTRRARVECDGIEYFLTGDLAHMDEGGFVYYEGRTDDIISSAGYRIGPTEVENALQEHPAVVECAVVASPDAERGEVVKAFVVLRTGHQPNESMARSLQEHVKRVTAPYKYPRRIEFVSELPKTATGKLLRRALRDAEFARASAEEQTAPLNAPVGPNDGC
jgi:acyl-coenzyme A synthetase/AMP-(fatty) acid ligase